MRTFRPGRVSAALVAVVGLLGLGSAHAQAQQTWTSQDGRLSIRIPANWPVDIMSPAGAAVLEIAAGGAAQECRFYLQGNDSTDGRAPQDVRRAYTPPIGEDRWSQVAIAFPFLERDVAVQTAGVDVSGFWPRQLATITSQGRSVYASLQGRPGYDVFGFCTTFEGRDSPDVFSAVLASVTGGNDAAWQAEAEAAAAGQTPPAPPASAPPQAQ